VRAVFNTSPVIFISKLGYFQKLLVLFDKVIIPPAVYREAMSKEDETTLLVKKLIEDGKVEIIGPSSTEGLLIYSGLHAGEIEVIAIAKEKSYIAVLDDLKARKVATIEGVRVIGTVGLLKLLKKAQLIDISNHELLGKLKAIGFRIKDDLFYEIMGEEDDPRY